ncbi:SRPBCC family protein [uncultured Cytophaga sp.]|uniref:SRPBCC family protein n=1 Tax=uncultured Cytophaga sp. TaxID=160238 RepID=UPI00262FA51E|nr:SRPBCC family protein [uncultured Cytophaga sp.]
MSTINTTTMHILKRVTKLPISVHEAWEFFSSPKNLQTITPPYMGFIIKSGADVAMYQGMLIRYTVTPLLGIPLDWVTEITHVADMKFFVDEQRVGPYAIWHHEHHFKAIPNGVEMTDIVSYKLPFGFIGTLLEPFIVKGKVEEIFNYRNKKMGELFGEYK